MKNFNRIEKIAIAYINKNGTRRVGKAYAVTADGEFFKVEHKAGYFEIVAASSVAA